MSTLTELTLGDLNARVAKMPAQMHGNDSKYSINKSSKTKSASTKRDRFTDVRKLNGTFRKSARTCKRR